MDLGGCVSTTNWAFSPNLNSARDSAIRISGTEKGEIVEVYSASGTLITKVVAEDGETVVGCPSGVNVVKIGDKNVKFIVK